MLNNIIRFSLYNRLIVLILSALLLIGGTLTIMNTEVDIFPDLNAPTVAIMTEAPGLAAEEVEQLVTYPVEIAVNGAQGVESVRSYSTTGFSIVNVIFTDKTDPLDARQTVAERLTQIEDDLPPAAESPVMGPQSSILGEMLIIGLTSDSLSMAEIRSIADKQLSRAIQGIQGISNVSVIGGDEIEYQIVLDQGLMKHFNVTIDDVNTAVENLNANSIGSVINSYGSEYVVKGNITTTDIESLAATVIRSDENGLVCVGDVATVKIGVREPKIGVASVETKPAVIMTVTKQPGTGTIDLTEKVIAEIERQKSGLPSSLNISTNIFAQRDFIDSAINNLSSSVIEGAIMVIIVLFFFMMNIRATFVSLLALPMSIIITVLILHLLGITINTMSLGGIAIAIGSLVDDAIVDVENVSKHLRQRGTELSLKERIQIVFDASKEVRMPIFNSSLIIIAGFMPLFFLSGIEGRLLIPLGTSFIIALLASTIVAFTLTPVICSYILPSGNKETDREPWAARTLKHYYKNGIRSALKHWRYWIIGVSTLFVITVAVFFSLGRGFLPSFNEGSFTINISALPGISLEESDRVGRMAEEIILSVSEIKTVARKTGRAELDEHSLGTNVSEIEAPYSLTGRSRSEIATELRHKLAQLPGVSVEIGQPISHRIDAMLSGTESPIVYKIYGPDLEILYRLANKFKSIVHEVEGLEDITIEQQTGRPEISIIPRRQVMARYGITPSQINNVIETAIGGKVVSTVYDEGYPRDIRLKFDFGDAQKIDALAAIQVDTPTGKISLGDIAEINSTESPNTINRDNTSRRITISANIEGRDLQSIVDEIDTLIAENLQLPEGYTIKESGQAATASAASMRLFWSSTFAILLIFIFLYAEFRSFSQSLIILVNMPLAAIGGILILWITGLPIDIPAIIGLIALLGISTRNGMLLISRYNKLISEGCETNEAIIKGSIDRLTPIIMTALTSALALLPLALRGGDPGNEIQSPLAIVILGGLLTSTLLNLFITPILYRINSTRKTYEKS